MTFCDSPVIINSLRKEQGVAIYGRRLALPVKGGDANVEKAAVQGTAVSGVFSGNAVHTYYRSEMTAPAKSAVIS